MFHYIFEKIRTTKIAKLFYYTIIKIYYTDSFSKHSIFIIRPSLPAPLFLDTFILFIIQQVLVDFFSSCLRLRAVPCLTLVKSRWKIIFLVWCFTIFIRVTFL